MIQDRIAKIEATLHSSQNIPEETRKELLALLAELKSEVAPLAETHRAEVQSIAEDADTAVEAATREHGSAAGPSEATEGLTSSVRGFEASHPRLVEVVDRLATTLSNMGI